MSFIVTVVACILTAALTGTACTLRARKQLHQISRYIRQLADVETHQLADSSLEQSLPAMPSVRSARATLDRLKSRFVDLGQELETTEHLRARADIRARRIASQGEHVQEILSSLTDPVLAIDQHDEVVLSNPSAARLFPHVETATEQKALATLVKCEELVELLTETRRRKAPAQRTGEVELQDTAGESHTFRITCRSFAGGDAANDSEGAGAVAVLSDISSLKAIQRRNAEFVSAVSHEMKTPLASIKAYTELLADGDAEDEETREEFLNVIDSQTERLQRLIDNLLNLARMEAGVVEVKKQARSLNELLEEAANVIQPAAEQEGIDFRVALSPMYLNVLADRDMTLQAAINLLSNAIKYTPEGGQVTLRSRLVDDRIEFEVTDTGVGLSEEDCERVFDKFYRVKKDQQMAPGTGLGLPLAKHIVEDVHGGQLTLTSELGRGSTFRISLPSVGQIKS